MHHVRLPFRGPFQKLPRGPAGTETVRVKQPCFRAMEPVVPCGANAVGVFLRLRRHIAACVSDLTRIAALLQKLRKVGADASGAAAAAVGIDL